MHHCFVCIVVLHVCFDESSASFRSQHHAHCSPLSLFLFISRRCFCLALNQEDGYSALHWAAQQGSAETVKVLVDAKANIYLMDMRGKTACEVATESTKGEWEEVVKLLDAHALQHAKS